MKLFNEHQYLLILRESGSVVGHKAFNLWLLVVVLFATFFSIAFSEGSMNYLDEKMNDPFTNWVNIDLHGGEHIDELKDSLDSESMQSSFGFDGYQRVVKSSFDCCYNNIDAHDAFSTLFYEKMRSDFIAAVLSKKNVIKNGSFSISPDSIADNSVGLIITLKALLELGYDKDHVPSFIDYHSYSPDAEELGINMMTDGYARAPMPLLGVVKCLPLNRKMIAARHLEKLISDGNYPFKVREDYVRNLDFFVPEEVDNFTKENITSLLDDSLHRYLDKIELGSDNIQNMLRSWRKGKIWRVYLTDNSVPIEAVSRMDYLITESFSKQGLVRIYGYTCESESDSNNDNQSVQTDDIISVHFNRLDSIRAFESFVLKTCGLQIEMTQIEAKENFNAVSTMANILTVALVIFAIIAIVIFIVNMMQHYFQKVKRNLGTFKAFGMSTKELRRVYMTIIAGIVVSALIIALTITWSIEILFNIVHFAKADGAPHLILWNIRSFIAILIILASTLCSVYLVMRLLLRHTPGDLIYDR